MKMIEDIQIKNIIVHMPNWVGDLVMATVVLSDLRKEFPKAVLTAMASRPVCELLKTDKDVDKIYCFKKEKLFFLRRKNNRGIIQDLRKGNYDLGILLTNSFSSARLFYRGHVRNVIGYKKDFRSVLIKYAIRFPKEEVHQIIKYKNLLKPLGIQASNTKPRIYLDNEEIHKIKKLLYQKGYKKNLTLIGINPLAKYGMAKCWPSENFRKLAQRLSEDKNNVIVFVGDLSSKDLIGKICSDLPKNVINIAGLTSLRELACIINECDLFITNDSGPMHVASALDVPLIALFGSTSQELTGPYNEKAIVINKKVGCSPCFKRICPNDFKCMKQITCEEVIEKIKRRC